MAKAPMDTPGWPLSSRARVPSVTPMRAAKSAIGIRRFFRAMRMSLPSVRSARCTEGGSGCFTSHDISWPEGVNRHFVV